MLDEEKVLQEEEDDKISGIHSSYILLFLHLQPDDKIDGTRK